MILAFCDKSYIVEVMLIIKTIFKIVCYIAPLLVIIVSIIHIFKTVLNGKEDDLKDALKVTVKRIIAGLLIAFLPALVNYFFTSVVNASEVEFLACFELASKEKVASLKAKEDAEEEAKKKAQEKEDEAQLRKAWEAEQKKKGAKKQSFEEWKKKNNISSKTPFNLEHAIQVHDNIHRGENSDLVWHDSIVGHSGGSIGAYTEAVNILNEKDYRIYEVYNVLVSAHPELKTTNKEPYECTDINDRYNFNVIEIESSVGSIREYLQKGCLVQKIVHSDKWRDDKGELLSWPGYHWGLIFYYDGTHYHMKAAGNIDQSNAIYTESQLNEWLDTESWEPVAYCKK